jgi:hypothetical protein
VVVLGCAWSVPKDLGLERVRATSAPSPKSVQSDLRSGHNPAVAIEEREGQSLTVVDLGFAAVAWQRQGNAWLEHIHSTVYQGQSPSSWGPRAPGIYAVAVGDEHMIAILQDDGIACGLIAPTAALNEVMIQTWVAAIAAATAKVQEGERPFPWGAVVGPPPRCGSSFVALEGATMVGPLQLVPGANELRETAPMAIHDQLAGSYTYSWPMVVNGTADVYDWSQAMDVAYAQLHRLCTLIAVAWDEVWSLRLGPFPLDSEMGPLAVPETGPLGDWPPRHHDQPRQRKDQSLPGWLNSAWHTLDQQPHVAAALNIHYEALQVVRRHPSFALLGFVAAIETIGQGPAQDGTGSKITKRPTEKRAFRAGLETVLTQDEAKATVDAYTDRSKFVHNSRLVGYEARHGISYLDFFAEDPARPHYERVSYLRDVSRRVLEHALRSPWEGDQAV